MTDTGPQSMTNHCLCPHGCSEILAPGEFICGTCLQEDHAGAAEINASLSIASKAETDTVATVPNLGKDPRASTVEHAATALGVITALVNNDMESAHKLINSVEWGVKDTMLLAAWAAQGIQHYAESTYTPVNEVLQNMALEVQFLA